MDQITDICREIIDESDVYIDVHKAIRRMAPAPKSRAQHGHVTGHPDTPVAHEPEEYLIDLSEGVPIAKKSGTEVRSESPATGFGTSPKTTFLKRSDSADGHHVAVRGNITDMREHLKHLGPSNLASKPKTTRYNSVKIKTAPSRSVSSRQDSYAPQESPIIEVPYSDEIAGGEGAGLLKSAGQDAKDGVHALQQGYGSIPKSPLKNMSQFTDGPKDTKDTIVIDNRPKSGSSERLIVTRQESQGSMKSSDTLASLRSGTFDSPAIKKGVARSGSITENIIESGGFSKVVLETTSSEDLESRAGSSRTGSKDGKKTSSFLNLLDGTGGSENGDEEGDGPKSEEVKKKRRRTRKKKSAKNGSEEGSAAGGSTA